MYEVKFCFVSQTTSHTIRFPIYSNGTKAIWIMMAGNLFILHTYINNIYIYSDMYIN